MSRGFVKEGDQEEVPMLLPRAFLPSGTPNYVTPEGFKLLQEEMELLKKERNEAGTNYIVKNHIDAKMRQLSERINSAVMIDPAKANPNIVSFGMYVKYNDKVIRIVGVDEADASKGLISFISPIAKSLIGKKKGDKFEIKIPKGTEEVKVQEVGFAMSNELRALSSELKVKSNASLDLSETYKKPEPDKLQIDIEEVSKSQETKKSEPISQSTEINNNENNPTEFLPLVNERGNIVGRALYCEIHSGNKLLHPAVHFLVYNSKNEIIAEYKWHVAFGETADKTLKRKLKEMQSQNFKPKFNKQYIREDKNEKELVSVFVAIGTE